MEKNDLEKLEEQPVEKSQQSSDELSDYERYCRQQADAFFDEIGDDRCFGDMAEGQFVRGH